MSLIVYLCSKAVIFRGNEFLVLYRSDKEMNIQDFHPEKFDLPGGQLSEGECFLKCIEREVVEETGLKVKNLGLIHVDVLHCNDVRVVMSCFCCEHEEGDVQLSHEHESFEWISLKGDFQKNIPDWAVKAIEAAVGHKKK